MFVKDFITEGIPVLKKADTLDYALSLMDDFKLRHLPIVDNSGLFIGTIAEKDLLSEDDWNKTVESLISMDYSIKYEADIYDALALISRYRLSVLPVISSEREYKGCVTLSRLIDCLANLCSADVSGSVVVLELSPIDYSLTEIVRLVEVNHVHIQNIFTDWKISSGRMRVILKIDAEDASSVIRTFERFNYSVFYYSMNEHSIIEDQFQRRIAEVERYMNI